MSTYGKYIDKYNQKKAKGPESLENKLVTDKEAYISFLETQLEKVSNVIIATKTFDERLENALNKMEKYDEKMGTVMKLVKMMQTNADSQEAENNNLRDKIQSLNVDLTKRISKLELSTNFDELESKIVIFFLKHINKILKVQVGKESRKKSIIF